MPWPYNLLYFLSQLIPGIVFSLAFFLIAYGIMTAFGWGETPEPLEFEQPEPFEEEITHVQKLGIVAAIGKDEEEVARIRADVAAIVKKYKELAREETHDEGETAQ